jgi:hypothetical protein
MQKIRVRDFLPSSLLRPESWTVPPSKSTSTQASLKTSPALASVQEHVGNMTRFWPETASKTLMASPSGGT